MFKIWTSNADKYDERNTMNKNLLHFQFWLLKIIQNTTESKEYLAIFKSISKSTTKNNTLSLAMALWKVFNVHLVWVGVLVRLVFRLWFNLLSLTALFTTIAIAYLTICISVSCFALIGRKYANRIASVAANNLSIRTIHFDQNFSISVWIRKYKTNIQCQKLNGWNFSHFSGECAK